MNATDNSTNRNSNTSVAIDYNHPDLGHGTHCAGIVGAIGGTE